MTKDRRCLWAQRVALALMLVLAGEILLRGVQLWTNGTPVTSFLPAYRETRFILSPFLVFGPRVDWEIPQRSFPELARFNSDGFRLPRPTPRKDDGEIRVIALGGSTTENVWNDAGVHWPLISQCALAQRHWPVQVLNGAMSAYSTAHSLVRLQFDVLEHKPDYLLLMHAVNDLDVAYTAAALGLPVDPNYHVKYGQQGYTGELYPRDVVLLRTARAVRSRVFLRDGGEILRPRPATEDEIEAVLSIFSRNLRSIILLARGWGIHPILVTMPYSPFDEDYSQIESGRRGAGPGLSLIPSLVAFSRDMDRFNDAIRSVASAEGASVIDMAARLDPVPGDFVDPVHYSTQGIWRFGEMASKLLEELLLEQGQMAPHGAYMAPNECLLLEAARKSMTDAGGPPR